MTARNRLRKRAAQKAKVTTFGVAKTRNQNTKTNKEPEGENNAFPDKRSAQVENHTSTANNNTGNGKSVDPDQAQTTITMNANSLIKTPTASTTVSVVPPQSCTIVCTAATIDPKSNQVQTVVVTTNSCNSNMNAHVAMKNTQGKQIYNIIFTRLIT